MDPSRRGVLAATLFTAALSVPAFQQSARAAGDPVMPGKATTRIGASQVASVRSMTERIADILDAFGAGHARPMAAAFLVNTVGPWLRAQASEPVKSDMLAAASDLTYLTGWMAMYEKAHGLGQTYYVKALELADEANDHVTYCRTLRGMSLQASNLGHGRMALELADSAAAAAPSAGPRLVAFLRGLNNIWLADWLSKATDLERVGLDASDVRKVITAVHHHQAVLDEITEPRMLAGDLWTVH